MSFRDAWGYAPFFDEQIDEAERETFVPVRVVEPGRTAVKVATPGGMRIAEPAGRLYADDTLWPPAAGDWVLAAPIDDERMMVQRILDRRTFLARGSGHRIRPLAANVDVGLIVLPLSTPVNLNLAERALALIAAGGAEPAVALTKADLSADPAAETERVTAVAGTATVVAISVVTGDGLDRIADLFRPGRTVALLGQSGVGKSSLVNRLAGEEVMATAAVREGDDKGRHTTTARRLLRLPNGGLVVDLPGFRELGLAGGEEEGLAAAFADVAEAAAGCRFADCSHEEEPGCAVRAAVEEGRLDRRRFESYRKLLREAASAARRADEAAARAHDRRFGKMVKRFMKDKKRREGGG